ncbi:hypothetical protein NK711_001178 [Salmonella enterica]|nr:hypothetical protein [Salmonella enterica]
MRWRRIRIPERLAELDSLDFLPTAVLHDVYMHCSYADLAEKHRIKRSLNDLIRRSLLAGDFADIAVGDISDAWQQVRLGVVPSGTVPKARRRKSL